MHFFAVTILSFVLAQAAPTAVMLSEAVEADASDDVSGPNPQEEQPAKRSPLLSELVPLDPRATEFEKIKQIDSSHWRCARGCGLNALYGYLKLHGRDISLEAISNAVPVGPNGATMEQLRLASNEFGLPSEVVFCQPADLAKIAKPCILHTIEQGSVGHYVVLLGTRANEERDFAAADFTLAEVRYYSPRIISRVASGYVLVPKNQNVVPMRALIAFAVVGIAGCCLLWRQSIKKQGGS